MIIEKKDETQEVKEEITTPEEVIEAPVVDEEKRKLEIENAELRGRAGAFESIQKSNSQPNQPNNDAWKGVFLSDLNALNEEEFEQKYKYSKVVANTNYLQNEFANQTAQQNQKFARISAENRLLSKYPDLHEFGTDIEDALSDLSPEVRQNPERLEKVIERAYLSSSKSNPKAKGETVERKNIGSNFEKPQPRKSEIKKEVSDEIPEEYRKACFALGVKSEKERQVLMSSDEVETHYGNGIVFRDSAKGFEKVA